MLFLDSGKIMAEEEVDSDEDDINLIVPLIVLD